MRVAVAEERVVAVPLVHAEVGVEAVGDGVPGHLPAHPRLQARDVRLRRARGDRRAWCRGRSDGRDGRPGRRPGSSRGRRGRASRTRRARRRRGRRSADGGPRTGRAGSPYPWARRTRTSSRRPSTASAGARRPARHGRGSSPFPSPAAAGARHLPIPCGDTIGGVFMFF